MKADGAESHQRDFLLLYLRGRTSPRLAVGDERRTIRHDIATPKFDWPVAMPVGNSVGQGLSKIRLDLASDRISSLCSWISDGKMVELHDAIREAQATPKTDLDLAPKRMTSVK